MILLIIYCILTVVILWCLSVKIVTFCLQTQLRKMLVNVASAFNDNDVYYWIDFGTLLGIIRENDIIATDNDIDICVEDTEETHKKIWGPVKTRLETLGYKVEKLSWPAYRVWAYGIIFADIYITKKDGDLIIGATGQTSDIPKKYIGKPKDFYWILGAIKLKVPEHIIDTIEWRYGENWRTPIRGYKGRNND